jgi:hypothetical protein
LLLTHRLKEYWASEYGRARVTKVLTPDVFKSAFSWRWPTRAMQFALALYARPQAGDFDVVICVERHLALAFGLVKRLTGLKTPVIAYQFILPDKDDAERKRLAAQWDRAASSGLTKIVVNSSHEAASYVSRLSPKVSLEFAPIAAGPEVFEMSAPVPTSPTIFSGGIAMRDYATLIRVMEDAQYRVEIVARHPNDLPQLPMPPNSRVRFNLPYLEFLREMSSATAVVIPLRHTERAAGQGTIIYAQAMGKAVIASDVPGLRDYIQHGATGLLVKPESEDDLREAIYLLLTNDELRCKIESASRQYALQNYSYHSYDQHMARIIAEASTLRKHL